MLLIDADVVVLQDLAPFVARWGASTADAVFQPDEPIHGPNTGFAHFRPTPAAIGLLEAALAKKYEAHDQVAMRKAISEDNSVRVEYVDAAKFPNGARYWYNPRPGIHKETDAVRVSYRDNITRPVIVHNNFLRGAGKKVERLHRAGLWFVPGPL